MMVFRSKERAKVAEIHAGFWLLFFSVLAILVAAPFGHLAGWINDFGTQSFPGLGAWIRTTGMKATDFQDGLISSHSHLIIAAFWCALSALTAIYFQYPFRPKWKKSTGTLGLWIALISLLLATIIYLLSAILGWEPPAFFGSDPNGVPLDDLVLTIGGVGLLLVLVGLSGVPTGDKSRPFTFLQKNIRLAIFLAWISSFVGAVVMGIYIEFHENFYGAGRAPAPGAINDNIFIRAHLLFPFFLLPIIFTVLLAVGCRHNQINTPGPWPFAFVWTSIVGMALGLIGEIMWFLTLEKTTFLAGIIIMGTALIAGVRATFLTDYRH
ncbi:MAG: hypothetical protein GWP10_05665 [Nitrospiraceae bacterium]|nr:hypothetical protein [Nitrospiraceae bacterium]